MKSTGMDRDTMISNSDVLESSRIRRYRGGKGCRKIKVTEIKTIKAAHDAAIRQAVKYREKIWKYGQN